MTDKNDHDMLMILKGRVDVLLTVNVMELIILVLIGVFHH
jgi:hypothetical protein